jgi:HD-GYP domain-containing protein (c-di-GMP phosphodiesterase class II)
MPTAQIEEISIAAAIHDVGKVSIPAEILSKPGALSDIEYELVKSHSQAGYDIIASAQLKGAVPEIVLQHHERCDGSGYPRGLTGDRLLIGSKIIGVADVVEAMSSHRPYRSALGVDAARTEIIAGAGVKFDEAVVKACLDALDGGFA